MTRAWTRWIPAAVAPVVVAAVAFAGTAFSGAALSGPAQAFGAADLPDRSAAQVLAMIADSSVESLSATVEQTADLGLPDIGGLGGGMRGGRSGSSGSEQDLSGGQSGSVAADDGASVASTLDLLTGSHTARVYLDGPTRVRVQVLDQLAERDLVRSDDDVWFYDSSSNTATHLTLPTGTAGGGEGQPGTPGTVRTPIELAELMLGSLESTTDVAVAADVVVAGRAAYEVTLSPESAHSLIDEVSIAVDGETGLPLRVQVLADGQEEVAYEVAFTALTIGPPAAERFEFVPPSGATVIEKEAPAWEPGDFRAAPGAGAAEGADGAEGAPDADAPGATATSGEPSISGDGWDTVVELPAGTVPSLDAFPLLGELTRAVVGGRVLETALVNVLLTDDGRVLVGAVTVERLQAVAAGA